MKISINKMLLLAATTLVTACVNGQPAPQCAVGHGGFAAKFTHVSGDTSGDCFRLGDIVGVQKYRQEDGTSNVYLKSVWLSERDYNTNFPLGGDAAGLANGELAANAPEGGFCTVPTLTAASGNDVNNVPLTYQWSNVRFYMSGAIPGTQFTADLTITGASCTSTAGATYRVDALYPVIFCSDYGVDNNGDGQITGAENDFTQNNINQSHCEVQEGEPAVDHVWSHLAANPTFSMTCAHTRKSTDGDLCRNGTLFGTGALGPTAPGLNCGQSALCVPAAAIPSVLAD